MRMVPAATTSFVVLVGGGVISALTNFYLASALGPAGKGTAQVLVTVPAILIVATNLGIHTAGAWFIGNGRYSVGQVLNAVLWWAVIISALLAIPFWAFHDSLASALGAPSGLVAISLGCVPLYILAYYAADVLMASGRFFLYAVLRLLPLVVYGVMAVLLVGLQGLGVLGATIAFAAGIAASGIYTLVIIVVLSGGQLRRQPEVMRTALGFGGYVHAGSVAQFLVFRVDVLIVNALQGSAAAGFYAVASSLAEIVWYAGRSVESVIVPRIARAEPAEARQITATALRVTFAASTAIAAGIAAVAQPLVPLLLPAYVPALPAMWLLLPGAIMSGVFVVAAGDLRGRGRPAAAAAISLVGLVLIVALTVVFVPWLGFVGAALASLFTYTAQLLVALYVLARVSGVRYRSMFGLSMNDLKLFRAISK